VLSNVISGSPILFEPFIEFAKYAAEYRNYHWQHVRDARGDPGIDSSHNVGPYPSKSDQIADRPRDDSGGNFGRLARTGIMDSHKEKLNEIPLCGIKTMFWREFLKAFQESTTDEQARVAIERLRERVQKTADLPSPKSQSALTILAELERLLELPS